MNRLCGGSRDSGCWARGCTLPLLAREHNNVLAFAFRWEQLWTKMAFCHHTAAARSWCLKEKGPLWQFHIRTLHSPLVSSSIHLHTEWKCQRAASLPCSILSLVSSQNLHAFYHLAKHWSGKLCPNVIWVLNSASWKTPASREVSAFSGYDLSWILPEWFCHPWWIQIYPLWCPEVSNKT